MGLSDAASRAASARLLSCWQDGRKIAALPDDCRPQSRADGYAVQAHLEAHSSRPLYGWKIAATSPAGQAHIGIDGPIAGRILAERVLAPGATAPLAGTQMRVAEVEFAFRLGRDLAPRGEAYRVEEVMDAVASLHPAIELPDSRFSDFASVGAAQLIADDACAHLFVVGEATTAPWRHLDLAAYAVRGRTTGGIDRVGHGANVLGDPRLALTWLVNEVTGLGLTVKSGQVISTGTTTVPLEIGPGDAVEADFGALGRIGVALA